VRKLTVLNMENDCGFDDLIKNCGEKNIKNGWLVVTGTWLDYDFP
jgi:hypothetical protein